MKKKFLLAIGFRLLVIVIAVGVLIGLNFLIYKSCNWITISIIAGGLSIYNVFDLRKEFKKILKFYKNRPILLHFCCTSYVIMPFITANLSDSAVTKFFLERSKNYE